MTFNDAIAVVTAMLQLPPIIVETFQTYYATLQTCPGIQNMKM